ncbi:Crp/Fnr family transcriptional regulator [Paenibacillus cisolokensis]|uniref:Crp/Fnr family transcriptional regulator n=1 Tax=Paenibacillus cisolokensis TaxID=1658519 RepID=UPI003D2CA220
MKKHAQTQTRLRRETLPPAGGSTAVFSPAHLQTLQDIAEPVRLLAGDYLYRENDPANRLYLVKKGSFKVSKLLADGAAVTLSLHIPGDLFGEPDPEQTAVHRFEARALEDAEVLIVQREDLDKLIVTSGSFALEFTNWMALLHRTTQAKFRDLLLFGKSGALCSLLLRLCNMYGTSKGDSDSAMMISKRITNAEMAEMIGSTRESVNRILNDLRGLGVITTEKGRIILKNPEYLRNICHCEDCPKEVCRM